MLPPADALKLWTNLDPLEAGVGALPPAIPDARAASRLITWVRVQSSAASLALRWAGINCTMATQVTRIIGEALGTGDGTPGQRRQLARAPVVEGSVAITSIDGDGKATEWTAVDDLLAAAPEVAAPGTSVPPWAAPATAFKVDAEGGMVQFGDGLAGQRPRPTDRLAAAYLASEGAQGNVAAGAIKAGPLLPGGIEATNPVPAWGGAEAETVADGERQISRLIGHRDRLVTAQDFRSIAWRTPGVAIGRIEVLPGWHPDLASAGMGFAPGVVTLMAIPARDGQHPAAPRADAGFLDALCRWLDPRRLVTTELHLRGPQYRGLWISVGVDVAPGHGSADVLAAVRARVAAFLSPLPADGLGFAAEPMLYAEPDTSRGWPLGKAVQARTLLAEVARVAGVEAVTGLLLAQASGDAVEEVSITGIELPEILGLSVAAGPPLPLAALRGGGDGGGDGGGTDGRGGPRLLPVPMVSDHC
jgi:predicted phage baseplate assembly protein